MNAIVKVNKNSSFANLNGLTFKIKEFASKIVALNINGTTTDFSYTEILICDFQTELQREYNNYNWGCENKYNRLCHYAKENKIKFDAEYTCPA
jgi:hypothetical protein